MAKNNIRIIVNADDLGISLDVNRQIEDCINRGVVSSTTLLVNAPAFEDGVRIAKQYSNVSVGVHLNLIEFAPLTNKEVFKKHGIVGDDGFFIEGAIFCVSINKELQQAVFEEWDAQINKVKEAGVVPSHCDSHQHTHTIPAFQEPLTRVLNKHGIKRVRGKIIPSILLMLRQRRRPKVKLDKSNAMVPKKKNVVFRRFNLLFVILASRRWNKIMSKRFIVTDSFFAFNSFYYDRYVMNLGGKNATVELMCHPGHKAYQNETNNLVKDLSWLDNAKYELISYNDL